MKRAYLAGRYSRREELVGYAAELREQGWIVDARWLLGLHQYGDAGVAAQGSLDSEADAARRFAEEDVADLLKADVLVSFTETPREPSTNRGGRHVEFGLAVGEGIRLVLVGPRENAFHYLPEVEQFDEWPDARAFLLGRAM